MKHNTVPISEQEHPFEAHFRQAQEYARQVLEERKRNARLPRSEDPLFKDVEVYDGPVPADLSARHDDYLYGEDD